jgi:hypothetical protein
MTTDPRGFPSGDLRVSDAERDQALSELSEAYRVGRISADEFDQRSTQALSARTGKELSALLVDLPPEPPDRGHPAAAPPATVAARRAGGYLLPRLTIGAALTAICFGGIAVTSALQPGAAVSGALAPAAVAVLCVVLVIALCVRIRRGPRSGSTAARPDARSPR